MVEYWRYYHVYNRGVKKIPLFLREEDYLMFIGKIGQLCLRYAVYVISFSVMPNHFHLELGIKATRGLSNSAANAKIGRFMHSLSTSYAVHYNKLYNCSGHVFQGTYKWKRIPDRDYLVFLSRYIHRNPAELAGSRKSRQRANYIRTYKWSSYQYYTGLKPAPCWLSEFHVLRYFGGYRKRYARFVENKVTKFKQQQKYRGTYTDFSSR